MRRSVSLHHVMQDSTDAAFCTRCGACDTGVRRVRSLSSCSGLAAFAGGEARSVPRWHGLLRERSLSSSCTRAVASVVPHGAVKEGGLALGCCAGAPSIDDSMLSDRHGEA